MRTFIQIDVGDMELFHPVCRTRVLITRASISSRSLDPALSVEAICLTCQKYVYMRLASSGMEILKR